MSRAGTDAGALDGGAGTGDVGALGGAHGSAGEDAPRREGALTAIRGLGGPVALVVSPHAGGASRDDAAQRALRAAGIEVGETLPVDALDRAGRLGPEWRARGYCAAVAAGGDGTIGAVASHVAGCGLPLGILPMGTSNDTARSLGLPLDVGQAARVIAAGHASRIDAGQAWPAQTAPLATTGDEVASQATAGAYFLHALTLGFNVRFAQLATSVARRERLGGLNYTISSLEALATYRPVAITLRFEGLVEPKGLGGAPVRAGESGAVVVAHDAMELAAVNAPVFGGALNFHLPQVDMRDRLLDFVLFEALDPGRLRASVEGALAALERLPDRLARTGPVAEGRPRRDAELGLALPGIHRYRARAAVIESERPLDLTLDGEVRAQTPALVRVAPEPIAVLLPAPPR